MNNAQRQEKLRLKQEALNQERDQALQLKREKARRRNKMLAITGISIAVLALLAFGISAMLPGPYDSFAKCLSEKGAIMYGAIDWCHYTQDQAGMFGKSFKHLDYRDYQEAEVAIKKTPTWLINGQVYENVQSLERLSSLTGCPL